MYKMVNFPITFGGFFFRRRCRRRCALPDDYGAITEKCEKNASSRLLSLQNESHSVNWFIGNSVFLLVLPLADTKICCANMQTLYNLISSKITYFWCVFLCSFFYHYIFASVFCFENALFGIGYKNHLHLVYDNNNNANGRCVECESKSREKKKQQFIH